MLRTLVLALLLANLLFFGWARGWFAPGWPPPRHGEREPERLAAQLRPELITVLPAPAASAALREAALPCLETGPLDAVEAARLEAALGDAGVPAGQWALVPAPSASAPATSDGPRWLRLPRVGADWQPRLATVDASFRPCEPR